LRSDQSFLSRRRMWVLSPLTRESQREGEKQSPLWLRRIENDI
jgi:hypothetical protein